MHETFKNSSEMFAHMTDAIFLLKRDRFSYPLDRSVSENMEGRKSGVSRSHDLRRGDMIEDKVLICGMVALLC